MEVKKSIDRYTFQDIEQLDGHWELIDGIPYNMTPAPSYAHQATVGSLFLAFSQFLASSGCKVILSPFDVRFSETEDYDSPDAIVQPDLSIFCNEHQIGEKWAKGAPTLVVEVLSRGTAAKDRITKFNLYEKFGVQEYWIVDTNNQSIDIHHLVDGIYRQRKGAECNEEVESFVFKGFVYKMNSQ